MLLFFHLESLLVRRDTCDVLRRIRVDFEISGVLRRSNSVVIVLERVASVVSFATAHDYD